VSAVRALLAVLLLVPACGGEHCATPDSAPLRGGSVTKTVAIRNGYAAAVDVNGAYYQMLGPLNAGDAKPPGPFAGADGEQPVTFRAADGDGDGRDGADEVLATVVVSGTPRTASMGRPLGCE
jgi:hypothetical protein